MQGSANHPVAHAAEVQDAQCTAYSGIPPFIVLPLDADEHLPNRMLSTAAKHSWPLQQRWCAFPTSYLHDLWVVLVISFQLVCCHLHECHRPMQTCTGAANRRGRQRPARSDERRVVRRLPCIIQTRSTKSLQTPVPAITALTGQWQVDGRLPHCCPCQVRDASQQHAQ